MADIISASNNSHYDEHPINYPLKCDCGCGQ